MNTDRGPLRTVPTRSSSSGEGASAARTAAVAVALVASLSACAGVTSAVREENRDTSGDFDGLWEARLVEGRKSYNRFGNWTLKCDSWSERFLMNVDGGEITVSNIDGGPSTYVDGSGRFRLEVPVESREVSSRESGSVGRTERKLILNGNLGRDEPRIVYTLGEAKYGWGGCNWPLEVERRG